MMDVGTFHMLARIQDRLDHIRETQILKRNLLEHIAADVRAIRGELERARSTPAAGQSMAPAKMQKLLKEIGQPAALWAAGLLTMAYIARGGDLVTALEKLSALF